jgi:hypothetical protein
MGLEDILEWFKDTGESIIDSLANIGDWFANIFGFVEDISSGGDSPLTHWAYWLALILYLVGTWYLPSKLGIGDYGLGDKIMGSCLFAVIDYFIIKRFME